jgi:hypothetical protein
MVKSINSNDVMDSFCYHNVLDGDAEQIPVAVVAHVVHGTTHGIGLLQSHEISCSKYVSMLGINSIKLSSETI